MTQEIQQKPYQSYFNHFYLPDSDDLETFENRFLHSCNVGVSQLVYRFTEHPTYLKMRETVKHLGFNRLLAKKQQDTAEKIQKIFLEACESGCHEVVTPLLSDHKKMNALSSAFTVGFDLASRGCAIGRDHLRDRFIRTLEAISESFRCSELSDEQLKRVSLASPLLQERHFAISSTNRVLEQLSNLVKSASPIPPSTTSASTPSSTS